MSEGLSTRLGLQWDCTGVLISNALADFKAPQLGFVRTKPSGEQSETEKALSLLGEGGQNQRGCGHLTPPHPPQFPPAGAVRRG